MMIDTLRLHLRAWRDADRDASAAMHAHPDAPQPRSPLDPHCDIVGRLVRDAWGRGYATEAAGAALCDAFMRAGLAEILAYAGPDNVRSHAVIGRLGMQRDAAGATS